MRHPRRAVHAAAASVPAGPFCDHCHTNLAPLPAYIRCAHALCNNLAICVDCFSVGAADRLPHRPDHPYRVIDRLTQPLFHPDWNASDEYRLLSAMSQHGPNHWKPVSEYVGKGMIKCQNHYHSVYLQPSSVPFPVSHLLPPQQQHQLADTHAPAPSAPSAPSAPPAPSDPSAPSVPSAPSAPPAPSDPSAPSAPSAPPASRAPPAATSPAEPSERTESPSAPTRDDFDIEWDNDAEDLIADLGLSSDDSQLSEDATVQVIEAFNARLQRRYAVKDYLLEGSILSFSEDQALCLKNEQTLSNRLYALCWLLQPAHFKAFSKSVMDEFRRAKCMYQAGRRQKAKRKARHSEANSNAARSKTSNPAKRRRTTKARSTPFSKRKRSSANKQQQHECPSSPLPDATMPNTPASAPMSPNSTASPSLAAQHNAVQPSPAFLRKAKKLRQLVSSEHAPPAPKPVDDMEDASKLSPAERALCAALHIPPTFFLEMKSITLLTVSAQQQRRRNDKQSSTEKIVVPPPNFARDLDQVDESSESTAKNDACEIQGKDSLVPPPLTLPQVVNNHLLSNNDQQTEGGHNSSRSKSEKSEEEDKELLDFLTHIPKRHAQRASRNAKGKTSQVELVKEEPVKQEPSLVKEESVDDEPAKRAGDKRGQLPLDDVQRTGNLEQEVPLDVQVKEEPLEVVVVKDEDHSIVRSRDGEMRPLGSPHTGDDPEQRSPEYPSQGDQLQGVEEMQQTDGSSPSDPSSRVSGIGGRYGEPVGPSHADDEPSSVTTNMEPSPEIPPLVPSESNHIEAVDSLIVHRNRRYLESQPRPRVYLRLFLRPPGYVSPDPVGSARPGTENPNTQGLFGQVAGSYGEGRDVPFSSNRGEGFGYLPGPMHDRPRTYLRPSIYHQAADGGQGPAPVGDIANMPNANGDQRTPHLQLPQSMVAFGGGDLQPAQRERVDSNAMGVGGFNPQPGVGIASLGVHVDNDRGVALPAMGLARDEEVVLGPQLGVFEAGRGNDIESSASIHGRTRSVPSCYATAGRRYLTPTFPSPPRTPRTVVESAVGPQFINCNHADAGIRVQHAPDVSAPSEQIVHLPAALTMVPAGGSPNPHGPRAFEVAAEVASPDVPRGTDGMVGVNEEGCGAKEGCGARSMGGLESAGAQAGNPRSSQSVCEVPGPETAKVTGDGPVPERAESREGETAEGILDEEILDEGKAETDDNGGNGSGHESSSSAAQPDGSNGNNDPDYKPNVGSRNEAGTTRRRGVRSRRGGRAASGSRHVGAGDNVSRKRSRVAEPEELVFESDGAESGLVEARVVERRRSKRLRGSGPASTAVTPARRSSRIQKRSRPVPEHSPEPRPLKKRRVPTSRASSEAEIGDDDTITERDDVSIGDGRRGSRATPAKKSNTRARKQGGVGKRSAPRRSSGRIVKKTHKAKELEIVTPQVDPQSATLSSSDSSDSLQLFTPGRIRRGRDGRV
ncbi:unnamed protein product [Agarophyton chilense]